MFLKTLSKSKNVFLRQNLNFICRIQFHNKIATSTTEAIVTPWSVEGKVDYSKLVEQFGTELITSDLKSKFQLVTNKELHPWIRRGIFFTHRGLNNFLNAYEKGEPVFLYTGRGPSSEAMHLGHLVPFIFTKWLQDVLNCPLVIQISDEEKSAFKQKKFSEIYKKGFENAKDIIACGFDPKKTFIFSNRDYRLRCRSFELLTTEMKNLTNVKEIKKIFGFDDDALISMYEWPFYQTAAAFYLSYPHIFNDIPAHCLVPHAIDQDPYFRLARDLSPRLNLFKPSNIMSKFVPSLSGDTGKMSSSSGQDMTIFLNDTPAVIREKVLKHSFSGGGGDGSLADHRKYGGNPDKDVSFQYLQYFEEDDDKLELIRHAFVRGDLTCGEMKELLLQKLIPLITRIQDMKSKVDHDLLMEFYKDKPLDGVVRRDLKVSLFEQEALLYSLFKQLNINFHTIYHEDFNIIQKDSAKEKEFELKLAGPLCKTLLLKGPNKEYFMLVCEHKTVVDMKDLKKKLGVSRLMFAEKETVKFLFNNNCTNTSFDYNKTIINCSVNMLDTFCPFKIINFNRENSNCNLTILCSSNLNVNSNNFQYLNFAPMRSDATMRILPKDFEKFINHFQFSLKYIPV